MKTRTDHEVLTTRKNYGGGFAHRLALAGFAADDVNLSRIKRAFPDLWEEYSQDFWYENRPTTTD